MTMPKIEIIWGLMLLQIKIAFSAPLSAINLRVAHMPALSKVTLSSSLLTISPNSPGPIFHWTPVSQERGQQQSQYRISVSRIVNSSHRLLTWDSGIVNSTLSQAVYSGDYLHSASRYEWTVQWWDILGFQAPVSSPGLFHVGLKDEWNGTTWIEGSMLRKDFQLTSKSNAVVYISGVGFFQLFINGVRVGAEDILAGAWKTWNKEVLYYSYDVSTVLKKGNNTIGVYLGSGWRDLSEFPPHPRVDCDKHERMVRLALLVGGNKVVGSDATWSSTEKSPIVSSQVYNGEQYDARLEQQNWASPGFKAQSEYGWKKVTPVDCFKPFMQPLTMPGIATQSEHKPISITPVSAAGTCPTNILGGTVGENNDLHLVCKAGTGSISKVVFASFGTPSGKCPNFKNSDCSSKTSQSVVEKLCLGKTSCVISATDTVFGDPCYGEVKYLAVIVSGCSPRNVSKYVVDFGENLSGWCRLKVKGTSGTKVTLRHAEVLQHPPYGPADGNIYVGNLRSAKATDVFIVKGDQEETFEPHFTYHGFRYVEVSGYPGQLTLDDITQIHFRTNAKQRTHFNSSSDILNRIQLAALMGQGSNMMSVPTDCDQRDERLGWMGDSALSANSIALNFDAAAFYDNWLRDIVEEENTDGSLPDIVPYARGGNRPADPSWSAAFPNNLWACFSINGDTGPAMTHWAKLMLYFDDIKAQIKKAGSLKKWPASYGDWVPAGPKVSNQVPAAFNYIVNLQQMSKVAIALKKTDDAHKLEALAISTIAQFNSEFFKGGCWDNCGQTSYGIAVVAGAVNISLLPDVTTKLIDDIVNKSKNHVTVGIIGAKALFPALVILNQKEIAVNLAEQTSYPSWGYMIFNEVEPATTSLWELWNSPTSGPGMNSRNHHMFSSISEWIVQTIGGIEGLLCRENELITFHAAPVHGISWSDVTIESSCGLLKHQYTRHGGTQCSKIAVSRSTSSEAILDCGSRGGLIQEIEFASLGMPEGGCGHFKINSSCHFPNTIEVIEKMCFQKKTCRVPSNLEFWNMPECNMGVNESKANPRRLFLQARCSNPSSINAHIHVPVGMQAELILPRYELATDIVTVTEGIDNERSIIPIGTQLKPHVNGVLQARWNDDDTAAVVSVGSGEYDFILQSN